MPPTIKEWLTHAISMRCSICAGWGHHKRSQPYGKAKRHYRGGKRAQVFSAWQQKPESKKLNKQVNAQAVHGCSTLEQLRAYIPESCRNAKSMLAGLLKAWEDLNHTNSDCWFDVINKKVCKIVGPTHERGEPCEHWSARAQLLNVAHNNKLTGVMLPHNYYATDPQNKLFHKRWPLYEFWRWSLV